MLADYNTLSQMVVGHSYGDDIHLPQQCVNTKKQEILVQQNIRIQKKNSKNCSVKHHKTMPSCIETKHNFALVQKKTGTGRTFSLLL